MNINWKNISGHEENIAQLQQLLQEDRLPHALLFYGLRGVGKFLTARVLAAALLCGKKEACGTCPSCREFMAETHPDFFVLEPEGKMIRMIKIEQIRKLQTAIAKRPYRSERQVVIIDQADAMNEAAANCLLKTLEEPQGQTVFILLAEKKDALLDTIVSRSMLVPFQPLARALLREMLEKQGADKAAAGTIASLAAGSFGRALELLQPEIMEKRQDALRFFAKLPELSLEEVWKESQRLGAFSRDDVQEFFSWQNMLFRDLLVFKGNCQVEDLYNPDQAELFQELLAAWSLPAIFLAMEAVKNLQKRLASNANVKLLIEQFLLKIRDIEEEAL